MSVDFIELLGRKYRIEIKDGTTLTPEQLAEQINRQAEHELVKVVKREDGQSSGIQLNKQVVNADPSLVRLPGRVIHRETGGRRKPKGWMKEEIKKLRLMKKR